MDIASYITIGVAAFIIGVLASGFILLSFQQRYKRTTRKTIRGSLQPKRRKIEFSKLILALVLLTYFIGVGVGVYIVFVDLHQLGVVLAFIGTPTAAAIGFYVWKAKAENIIKIKLEHPEKAERMDFSNIHH